MLTPSEPVTVVGAGLIGSLFSLQLGRRGHEVTLLERRPDMRKEAISAGRSINLAVSVRGLHALAEVGLTDAVLAQAVPMRGRMVHSREGALTFQPYGKDPSECIYSISRGDLNRTLMSAAEASGKVKIEFNARVEACDLSRGELTVVGERDGVTRTHRASTLFGTDGSASAVRAAVLGQADARADDSALDYGYKELVILPREGEGGAARFWLEPNALHIWPRGTFMLIALPNHDGSFTVTLFLRHEGTGPSFATLTDAAAVRAFFVREFPDAVPLLHELETTFFANPTGKMITLRTSPWSYGESALLLGDAAHAIVPFFGQGMNCGFEDVTHFCSELDAIRAGQAPLAGFFARFGEGRKPDSDAIATMALENFLEMRDKVGDARFQLMKEVEKLLERELPTEYISRYRLVSFHRVPYRRALELGRAQDRLLAELCEGITRADQVNLVVARRLVRERLGGA